jgi:hypothetical protein
MVGRCRLPGGVWRVLASSTALAVVFYIILHRIGQMCWNAAMARQDKAIHIYFAGCFAMGVCAAIMVEGARPLIMGEPPDLVTFATMPVGFLLIGLIMLPFVALFIVTDPRAGRAVDIAVRAP